MTKLTDAQSILLSTASQRNGGSLHPLPATLSAPKPAIAKSIAALMARGLAEERETDDHASVHRTDRDLRYGVFITAAGLAAIGASEEAADEGQVAPTPPARASNTSAVIALLQRAEGASLPELIAATGWLPHTTRAAMTGLRKKGHAIERSKHDGATCYRIVGAA